MTSLRIDTSQESSSPFVSRRIRPQQSAVRQMRLHSHTDETHTLLQRSFTINAGGVG